MHTEFSLFDDTVWNNNNNGHYRARARPSSLHSVGFGNIYQTEGNTKGFFFLAEERIRIVYGLLMNGIWLVLSGAVCLVWSGVLWLFLFSRGGLERLAWTDSIANDLVERPFAFIGDMKGFRDREWRAVRIWQIFVWIEKWLFSVACVLLFFQQ